MRHHSLGPAELAALMGAWHAQPVAVEPRFRWIVALEAASANDLARALLQGEEAKEEGKSSAP